MWRVLRAQNGRILGLYNVYRCVYWRLLEIGKFGIVGILATATHYSAAIIVLPVAGKFSANVFGYCVAVSVSYCGHRYFTFGRAAQEQRHSFHIPRFVFVSLSAVAMSQLVLFLVGLFEVSEEVALGIAVLVIPPYTFVLLRLWVFRERGLRG